MNEKELEERAKIILTKLDIPEKERLLREIEVESMSPDFWKDQQAATKKMKRLGSLQKELEDAKKFQELLDLGHFDELGVFIKDLESYLYLSGPYDGNNVIMTIHAGQGGVDAMDWTQMLYRMYGRFFEKRGWSVEEIDIVPGDEAGLKKVVCR